MRTITSWPTASETACLCALGSLWCTSRTWLLARCLHSQAKSEECPAVSMYWRNKVQTESESWFRGYYEAQKCVLLVSHHLIWVLSFSLLFSFSIVITAGYVILLAGFGVMPIFCASSGVGRHSEWLLPEEAAKLRYAQQWEDMPNAAKPWFAPFFQSISAGVCCTLAFRRTALVAAPSSGLPSAAWKSAARRANFSPLQMLHSVASGVLPIHIFIPVYAAQAGNGGKLALQG